MQQRALRAQRKQQKKEKLAKPVPDVENQIQPANKIPQICPSCYTVLPDSFRATQFQHEQVRTVIAKVYHFLEREYDELKCLYPDTDLSMLSEFSRRTADATGVAEDLVQEILGEEADKRPAAQPPPAKRARTAEDGVSNDVYEPRQMDEALHEPDVYVPTVPTTEPNPLMDSDAEHIVIKEEHDDENITYYRVVQAVSITQAPPDELHSQYINVNSTVVGVSSDEILRRDKQKTISKPTAHVSTTYISNPVTDVSSDEIVRRDKQKTISEPTGHVSTE
uniref:Uncharacterized protein n=1 Tax=Heliothis virescens TaxID=7102 RepID=A0A2A4K644_HELVI